VRAIVDAGADRVRREAPFYARRRWWREARSAPAPIIARTFVRVPPLLVAAAGCAVTIEEPSAGGLLSW